MYNRTNVYTCAVTDPQPCAFKYAVKTYTVDIAGETCLKDLYAKIILGCDASAQNGKEEFIIYCGQVTMHTNFVLKENVPSGHPCLTFNYYACEGCGYKYNFIEKWNHDYASESETTDGQGNTIRCYNDCKNCGQCVTETIDAKGNVIKRVTVDVDYISEDGAHGTVYVLKETTTVEEYIVSPFGATDLKYTSTEVKYVYGTGYDGEGYGESFRAYSYLYDYEEGFNVEFRKAMGRDYDKKADACYKVVYEVDKDGNMISLIGVYNICELSHWITDVEPTCTQFGDMHIDCSRCQTTRYTSKIHPTFHHWRYDDMTGMYECMACGIQNKNGANGNMSLEDCNDLDTNEDTIIVGYYLNTDPTTGRYLDYYDQKDHKLYFGTSITLIDKNNDYNQFVIDVEVTRLGVPGNYVVFSKAEVLSAAKEAGYDISKYDVRLSFVPIGSSSYLDYGITFTDLFN